ncbi:gamma-glutamylcyclotransferase family protein [Flavobacterium anhuiense]|uniref:gamma-glutamylcyclotransferase family protein n=1 Tax=Flavobacterium anhuiense TaxID=459526 RepID=UPI003D95F9A6
MYYFAYGSNMDEERMKKRCVVFTTRKFGVLKGYRLVFNKKASAGDFTYANIEIDENDIVEGVLYQISEAGIASLDKFEGYPKNYYKENIDIQTGDETVSAIVYIANKDKIANNLFPKKEYLSHILAGKDLLSQDYFERLLNVKTLD